ncbi:MAG: hypothetical protein RL291_2040 [Pseudomonadota bacterium]|jgi:endogenous inhibitor of DNA gyrase (YacG/DUF329 family)
MTKKAMGRCPICKSPSVVETRPFCSKKCADVDLNRWLSESYVIADGGADADEDGDSARARDSAEASPPQRKH